MQIKNRTLLTRGGKFADAFNELGNSKALDTNSKMKIIKLRRQIGDHIMDLQTLAKDMTDQQSEQMLADTVKFDIEPIDATLVTEILTADQLYVLSGTILTEV